MLTKQPIISTDNKLNSSLLNRDDNLQYFDLSQSLSGKLNSMTTATANNGSSISTNATSIQGLLNADVLHGTQIQDSIDQDVILQNNINLKQNIISLSSKLSTTNISTPP
jgi:hypothetical protein